MTRLILTYGLISGLVVIAGVIATILAADGAPQSSPLLGYLIMLVALSAILVGVKQHRDRALGGVIRFLPALGVGVGIAAVAGVAYVVVWEIYLAFTDYRFMEDYARHILAGKQAAGVSAEAYAKAAAEMETLKAQYANPLFRLPMTFLEIIPVGLLVALASAGLLRNPRFLPARSPKGAG